jgi:hypothetical protein
MAEKASITDLPARGMADRPGTKRIVVAVDDEIFDRINLLAGALQIKFAEATRILLDRGLTVLAAPPPKRRKLRTRHGLAELASAAADQVTQ